MLRHYLWATGSMRWSELVQSLPAALLLALSLSAWRKARAWRRESLHTLLAVVSLAVLLYTVEYTFGLCQMYVDGGESAGALYFNSWLFSF